MAKTAPCLWFDGCAVEAAEFYVSLLPDSRIDAIVESPVDYPAGKAGDVLYVDFTLAGQPYVALNAGPGGGFTEAVSFQIYCDDQDEVDRLADALSAVPEAEQCSWVKDRFGVSWQILPRMMLRLLADPDRDKAARAMAALMTMKRLDIAEIERAARGVSSGGS